MFIYIIQKEDILQLGRSFTSVLESNFKAFYKERRCW